MRSRDFCYWLQGFFELGGGAMDAEQCDTVKKHLAMVFKHEIDPSAGSSSHQQELTELHAPTKIGDVDPLNPNLTMRC